MPEGVLREGRAQAPAQPGIGLSAKLRKAREREPVALKRQVRPCGHGPRAAPQTHG